MRSISLITLPVLAAFAALPLSAQVSARLHVDIPIGRPAARVVGRPLAVREYDPALVGDWQDYYDDWAPETVYLYDGQYYDYPVVAYATPVIVYRYRDQMFFAPRGRDFVQWRSTRYIGRDYRPGTYQYRSRPVPERNDRGRIDYRQPPTRVQGRGDSRPARRGGSYQPPRAQSGGSHAQGGRTSGHAPRSGQSGNHGGRGRP
ncbi:MAG TPA: hypothetical protein VGM77_02525 [Gemmatimonadales bacterium]|jgi:hypothetical protein